MVFSIFFSITVILTTSFIVTKKNLHLFEILFIWMVIIIIHHNVLTVTAVNMHMFNFDKRPAGYWTLVLIRIFLIPLLIVWYFDKTLSEKPFKKWAWLPVGILVLIGVEYLTQLLRVFTYTRWKLWWSVIEWFAIFLVANYLWLWYRNLRRREMT